MAELRIALNSGTPSGVGNNEVVVYPDSNGLLNVLGPDGVPKTVLTDNTTLNDITVSGALTKTGTAVTPNIGLGLATTTEDGAMSNTDKQLLEGATADPDINTLVKRDNTGSFEAATITANLFEGPSTSTQLIPSLTGAITSNGTSNVTVLTDGYITHNHIAANADIELSKLATDPLARSNHTGTQVYTTISNFNAGVDNYLTTNKITTDDISPSAGITMTQLSLDPTNRTNHTGPHPASALDGLATEVNSIINTYLVNNPISTVQIAADAVTIDKLNFNPLDRTTHTGNMPAGNIAGLDSTVRGYISGSDAIEYNSATGQFSLDVDTGSLKYTSSGLGISDTYVLPVSQGGTGETTKAKASHSLVDITTINTNTTLSDSSKHILAVTSATNLDITLPPANGDVRKYYIKKKSAANVLNINTDGTDTIEGQSSLTLNGQYDYVILQNDESNLWVMWGSSIT